MEISNPRTGLVWGGGWGPAAFAAPGVAAAPFLFWNKNEDPRMSKARFLRSKKIIKHFFFFIYKYQDIFGKIYNGGRRDLQNNTIPWFGDPPRWGEQHSLQWEHMRPVAGRGRGRRAGRTRDGGSSRPTEKLPAHAHARTRGGGGEQEAAGRHKVDRSLRVGGRHAGAMATHRGLWGWPLTAKRKLIGPENSVF